MAAIMAVAALVALVALRGLSREVQEEPDQAVSPEAEQDPAPAYILPDHDGAGERS
jgi:hypothetical protein